MCLIKCHGVNVSWLSCRISKMTTLQWSYRGDAEKHNVHNTSLSESAALECGVNLWGVYKCGQYHYRWKGGGVRIVCLSFVYVRPPIIRVQLHDCVCVFAFTRATIPSGWSANKKKNAGQLKYFAVVSSAFLCSGACRLDSPTHLSLVLRQRIFFFFCVVPFTVCGTLVTTRSRETLSMYVRLGCTHTALPLIARGEDLRPCQQRQEKRNSGGAVWRSGVRLKRLCPFQQHAQEKALQQQAEEETASSQAGEKKR